MRERKEEKGSLSFSVQLNVMLCCCLVACLLHVFCSVSLLEECIGIRSFLSFCKIRKRNGIKLVYSSTKVQQ